MMTLIRVARDMSANYVGLSSNLNGVSFVMAHWSSLEWTPPCHGGDHRFKSGMGRLNQMVWYANG